MKTILAAAAIALVAAIVSAPVHAQALRAFGAWGVIDSAKAPNPSPGCVLYRDYENDDEPRLEFTGSKYSPDVVAGALTKPGARFGFKTGFRVDLAIDDDGQKMPLAASSFNDTISFGLMPLDRQYGLAAILKGALTGGIWNSFTVDLGSDRHSFPLGPDFREAVEAFENCLTSKDDR